MNPSTATQNRRFNPEEYDLPYSIALDRSGYCHKLPKDWRLNLGADVVVWFLNDATEFTIGPLEDVALFPDWVADWLENGRWFLACCPIEPSAVPKQRATDYWNRIKAGHKPDPRYPSVNDFIRLELGNHGSLLATFEEVLPQINSPLGDCAIALRFRPQLKVLKTLPPELKVAEPYWRWVSDQLVAGQISYGRFLESLARREFQRTMVR
jgi:hypothetical protein